MLEKSLTIFFANIRIGKELRFQLRFRIYRNDPKFLIETRFEDDSSMKEKSNGVRINDL